MPEDLPDVQPEEQFPHRKVPPLLDEANSEAIVSIPNLGFPYEEDLPEEVDPPLSLRTPSFVAVANEDRTNFNPLGNRAERRSKAGKARAEAHAAARNGDVDVDAENAKLDDVFASATSTSQLINMAIGAGSMAWEHVDRAGVFDEAYASRVADAVNRRLAAMIQENVVAGMRQAYERLKETQKEGGNTND